MTEQIVPTNVRVGSRLILGARLTLLIVGDGAHNWAHTDCVRRSTQTVAALVGTAVVGSLAVVTGLLLVSRRYEILAQK